MTERVQRWQQLGYRSDGEMHASYAYRFAVALTVVSIVLAVFVNPISLGIAQGAWAGYWVTPDRDHHVTTNEEYRLRKVSPALAFFVELYWWPYQKLMPHRGRSHNIPSGTADRFVLLFWLPLLASCYVAPSLWLLLFWLMVFVGQCCVDAVHLWLDGLI